MQRAVEVFATAADKRGPAPDLKALHAKIGQQAAPAVFHAAFAASLLYRHSEIDFTRLLHTVV